MCDNQFDTFNGCNGICLKRPLNLHVLTDFFQDNKCNNLIGMYPGMCEEHTDNFKLRKNWKEMPDDIKSVVYYISDPNKCPLVFFELFIMSHFIPWRIAVKILLEPLCFWIINEQHFALTILFGYRFLGTKACEENNVGFLLPDAKFSYAYVLDSICEILGWIMDGHEDTDSLRMTQDELIAIKWLKITQLVLHGFMLCLGANGMPRQIPNFIPEWQDVWKTRFTYWIELYLFNNVLDESQAKQAWKYFDTLLEYVRICASYAFHDPGVTEQSIENLQQRVLEYEELFTEQASLT